MWGSWFGVTLAGLLILVAFVSLIFGTSIAVFGILIALGLLAALAVGLGLRRAAGTSEEGRERTVPAAQPKNPRSGGAPAAGEGAAPADTPPAPHEPSRTP